MLKKILDLLKKVEGILKITILLGPVQFVNSLINHAFLSILSVNLSLVIVIVKPMRYHDDTC